MEPTDRDTTAAQAHLADLWDLPGLVGEVEVVRSGRLTTSLGLYDPRKRQVRLAAFLDDASDALFHEVLVHELAHAAVHLAQGDRGRVRPHGREWKAFMVAAGLAPRVRMPREVVGGLLPQRKRKRVRWAHHCKRCDLGREAGRPMRRWRCRACLDRGRSGVLEITRVEPTDA